MASDGLQPLPFGVLLGRLAHFNVVDRGDDYVTGLGCRALGRDFMGLGSPYVIVRAEDDEDMIHAVEIEHVLGMLGIPVYEFLAAPDIPEAR